MGEKKGIVSTGRINAEKHPTVPKKQSIGPIGKPIGTILKPQADDTQYEGSWEQMSYRALTILKHQIPELEGENIRVGDWIGIEYLAKYGMELSVCHVNGLCRGPEGRGKLRFEALGDENAVYVSMRLKKNSRRITDYQATHPIRGRTKEKGHIC